MNAHAPSVRRADVSKGPPLRILSLDGGGVRGFSMLILLEEFMHKTYVKIEDTAPKRHEIPKPCDHFDLIAGTGTGGLIAIMLGRLRMDIETCKEVYDRMTRRVFETDKRFAGIPLKSTLFKASKLEEAICDCVREHTIFDDEGNDSLANAQIMSPMSPQAPNSMYGESSNRMSRSMSSASRSSYQPSINPPRSMGVGRWGNPNALLYDGRENRTKTAVTAAYRGTKKGATPEMLRSYNSRKGSASDFNCSIWQAGRATTAIGPFFKPIQIGHVLFIDEGTGQFNPSPHVLDEATVNEWPGRDVGVFLSVGTGKRTPGTNHQKTEWWEGFAGGSAGDFAEARRRLTSKIDGCEDTHQYMLHEYLARRGVDPKNYYRLNVEEGVGEFKMNEWARLPEISTNTRMYLNREEVQYILDDAAQKMAGIQYQIEAQIEQANRRSTRPLSSSYSDQNNSNRGATPSNEPPTDPSHRKFVAELPAEEPPAGFPSQPHPNRQYPPAQQQLSHPQGFLSGEKDPSDDLPEVVNSNDPRLHQGSSNPQDRYMYELPDETRPSPPPVPPKTPISGHHQNQFSASKLSPQSAKNSSQYPGGPPPDVNMARKPIVRN